MKRSSNQIWLYRILLIAVVLTSGCGPALAEPSTGTPAEAQSPSAPTEDTRAGARDLLEEALDVIEATAWNSDQVDWEALRAEIFGRLPEDASFSDMYVQIQYTLGLLGDHHSHMMTPEVAAEYWSRPSFMDFPDPWGELVGSRYGYIWMGGFASGDAEITNAYASELQQIVIDLDGQSPCAWVVDLRENNGGDLYAMIAGLGELIGDGVVSQHMNKDGELSEPLIYRDGGAWVEGQVYAQASQPDFSLATTDRTIVILIGRGTVSSGEALSLAFKGNPNAISLGHDTAGLTTGNSRIELSDGSLLFITSSVNVDPNGQVYGGTIQPEIEFTHTGYEEQLGTIPEEVFDWLGANAACEE